MPDNFSPSFINREHVALGFKHALSRNLEISTKISPLTLRKGQQIWIQIPGFQFLCISLGCFNNMPETWWLNQQEVHFLTVMEAEESRIKVWADLVFGKGFLTFRVMSSHCVPAWSFLVVCAWRKIFFLLRPPFMLDQDLTLMTLFELNHFLKVLSPNTITLYLSNKLGLQHMSFKGTQFQSMVLGNLTSGVVQQYDY